MARISVGSPGMRIFNSCDKKAAIPEIKKHLVKYPNDGLGHYYLGLSYDIIGDGSSANQNYSNGIMKADSKAVKKFIVANLCSNAGNSEKAIKEAKKAIDIDPYFGDSWSLIGNIYKKEKNYNQAIKAYENANDNDASDSNWNYLSLFHIYSEKNDLQKAEHMLDKAIAECDTFTVAYVTKAMLALEKNDWRTFETCLKKAMTLNPLIVNEFRKKIENLQAKDLLKKINELLKDVVPDTNKSFAFKNSFTLDSLFQPIDQSVTEKLDFVLNEKLRNNTDKGKSFQHLFKSY